MSVYPTTYKLYAYLGGSWVDITHDAVTDPIEVYWGMPGNGPLDRLAQTGQMKFTLNNISKAYSPGMGYGYTDWDKGTPIKLVITFDGLDYVRFRGVVDTLRLTTGVNLERRVFVTVVDWMGYASKFPLTTPVIQTYKTADVAISTILAAMPIRPQATSLDMGANTFPALFDTTTTKTLAYTELTKLALSELGYISLRKDRINGETLTFENFYHRNGNQALTTYPKPSTECGLIMLEDGSGYIALESSGRMMRDETLTFVDADGMIDAESKYGENISNRVTITAYPKKVDDIASPKVLYSLSSPMVIGSGQTITFTGNYTDPAGSGAQVNAISATMIAPTAGDYTMNTLADGTGTDLTANLTVSAVFSTGSAVYTVTNTSSYVGYITKLQARGQGVYEYAPIMFVNENATSEKKYGVISQDVQQQYQRDLAFGSMASYELLYLNKSSTTILNKVTYNANASADMMQAFLNLDIGDVVSIQESQTGVSGYHYIQACRFSIVLGGVIDFGWTLRPVVSIASGYLSPISVEFHDTSQDMVNFGPLPQVSNPSLRSVSAWIYPNALGKYDFAGLFSDAAGFLFYMDGTNGVYLYEKGTVGAGTWHTNLVGVLPFPIYTGQWNHVVFTRDLSNPANYPSIYINGTPFPIIQDGAQVGPISDETGSPLMIGNHNTLTVHYPYAFNGKLSNVQIYNRILTRAEIATLAGDATGCVNLPGVMFHGLATRTVDTGLYTAGKTLTVDDVVMDNAYRAIGIPSSSPIGHYPI